MQIETYIKNEASKYKSKAIKNKKSGVNLDKLEKIARQHTQNCMNFIDAQHLYNYAEECKYKDIARTAIEKVDEDLFGCINNNGVCIGYNFYGN